MSLLYEAFEHELYKIAMHDSPGEEDSTSLTGAPARCEKCSTEIKEKEPRFCPKCGSPVKMAPKGGDLKERQRGDSVESGIEAGRTGGDAAADEELEESATGDMGKHSSMLAHPLLTAIKGGTVLGAGGFLGYKGHQMMGSSHRGPRSSAGAGGLYSRPQPQFYRNANGQIVKTGGVKHSPGSRMRAFNLRPRGATYGSVQEGLDRIAKATSKHTKRSTPVV